MKFTKKITTIFLIIATLFTCMFSMTGCLGAKKTDFQKMFDDLGTNFIFVNNTKFDSQKRNSPTYMKLFVMEDAMAYDCYAVSHDSNSSLYYDLMVYEKTGSNYTQYKRTINAYFNVQGVETNVISAKEYKRRIENVVKFLLLPLADYESDYNKTVIEPSEDNDLTQNAILYELDVDKTIQYSFKSNGIPVIYKYKDVQICCENGKIMQIIYYLDQTLYAGTSNETHYSYEMYSYARNVCEYSDVSNYISNVKSYT